jgi:hypothetical protein
MDMNAEDPQDPSQTGDVEPQPQAPETPALETPAPEAPAEAEQAPSTPEDALAEIRRSLREEETKEKTGLAGVTDRLRKRLFGRKRKAPAEESSEAPSRLDELGIPEAPSAAEAPASEAPQEGETVAEGGEARPSEPGDGRFSSLVRKKLTSPLELEGKVEPEAPEPAPIEEIEAPPLPSEAEEAEPVAPARSILTSLRADEESDQEVSTIRQEALEDYVMEPAEAEDEGHTSLAGRLRRSWRYMRPLERNLLIGALMIVGLAVLLGSGFLVVQSLPKPVPTATPTTSITPIPISISLPGGWVFPLRTGFVVDGKWNPQGAEWLIGTEVCRWVSLPWNVQLEAVLRTLTGDDEIRLSMSNYDTLVYKVQSIQQVPASEISKLSLNTPSLLVILSKQDSPTRWVVTAKP